MDIGPASYNPQIALTKKRALVASIIKGDFPKLIPRTKGISPERVIKTS